MAKGSLLSLARVKKKRHRAAKMDDKLAFFTQFSTLLGAGTPVLRALNMTAEQCESERLATVLNDLADRVASGSPLYGAAAEHPKIFENQWIQMIRIGEISGKLASTLKDLTTYIQRSKATQGKVVSAMMYPAILAGISFVAIYVMLWKVVPTFAEFFADSGAKLPAITQAVVSLSDFIAEWGLILLGGAVGTGFLLRRYLRTRHGKQQLDTLVLTLPIFGELVVQSSMERFATNLGLLLKSGTPLLEAIRAAQEIFSSNAVYYGALGNVWRDVSRGRALAQSLEETGLFTPMMVGMVRVGEETGQLIGVLEEAADYYRQKVDSVIGRITGLLEPAIIIGMGVVVSLLLGSIYLPMFQLAGGGG